MGTARNVIYIGNHSFASSGLRDINEDVLTSIQLKAPLCICTYIFVRVVSSDFSAATSSQNGDTMKDIKYRGILLATTFMYTNKLIGREQNVAMLLYRA